jgi:hypothetical protein
VVEVIKHHPPWFAFSNSNDEIAFRNSIMNRIVVGTVLAGQNEQPTKRRPRSQGVRKVWKRNFPKSRTRELLAIAQRSL